MKAASIIVVEDKENFQKSNHHIGSIDSVSSLSWNDRVALDFFGRIKPFSSLALDTLIELAASSRIKSIDSEEFLTYEGDENSKVFIPVTGRLMLLKSSPGGKDLIVDFVPAGDVFPLALALNTEFFPLSVKAHVSSKILFITKSILQRTLTKHPMAYRELSENITGRLESLFDMSCCIAHDRVEVRVAVALFALAKRLGMECINDQPFVINISRKELADLTGTAAETASRVCKALESTGILNLSRAGVVMVSNPTALKELTFS